MRLYSLLLVFLLSFGMANAQTDESSTHKATSTELSNKSFTFKHVDAPPTISAFHQFEIVFASTPGTSSINVVPCMRSGTCGPATTISTSSSVVIPIQGIWDYYNVHVTWTNPESAVTLNILGIHN